MAERKAGSRSLSGRAAGIFPGGVNSPVRYYPPYPVYISSGKGRLIRDADGNSYTDYVLGYGPLILGHSHPAVSAAVARTASEGMLFGAPTESEVTLGAMIKRASPSMEMLRFVPSGSEATMHALRLSMFHTGRKNVLKVRGGYHGTNTLAQKSSHVREVEFNSVADAERELGKRKYAAFILEPVLGNCGLVPPADDYLARVRDMTERTGTLLVCDEVITGFRTRFGTYSESAGVRPDMITLGKIVGGGMPLAAYGGAEEIMKHVRPSGDFQQAGTYASHPVSVAAGIETLRLLGKSDYSVLKEMSEEAAVRLRGTGLTVNSLTGMISLFFTKKNVGNGTVAGRVDGAPFFRLFRTCLENGIYLPPSQQELIFMSFAHRKTEVIKQFDFIAERALEIYGQAEF